MPSSLVGALQWGVTGAMVQSLNLKLGAKSFNLRRKAKWRGACGFQRGAIDYFIIICK